MAVTSSRFKEDTNVFYLTGWGHAGDHWLSKALNAHPEIFVVNCYEPARLKYFNDGKNRDFRPDLLTMTAFLEDIGTDYQAIGECHAYRASQMGPVRAEYGDRIPLANLFRHPYTWLDFFIRHRVNNCRMPGNWSGALEHEWIHARHDLFRNRGLKPYEKKEVGIWAAYQGMWLLHNILVDLEHTPRPVRIEDLLTDRQAFQDLVHYLTKGRCQFSESQMDVIYGFARLDYRGEESYVDEWAAYESWPDWKKRAFEILVPTEIRSAYEKLGYRFANKYPVVDPGEQNRSEKNDADAGMVIFSSMMKSGTWMMRKVIGEITGLRPHEPVHDGDCAAFENAAHLDVPPGTFFSWHFLASPDIRQAILTKRAKLVFLYRNLSDALVSLYYHFLHEPDASIGYPTKNREFFNDLSAEGAMICMINGFDVPPHYWIGASLFIRQMESMLRFSTEYPVHFVSYDSFLADRENEIRRLADFLGRALDEKRIQTIADVTSFSVMKMERAANHPESAAHFRKGTSGDHAFHMTPFHHRLLRHLIITTCPELPRLLVEHGRTDFFPADDFYPMDDFRTREPHLDKIEDALHILSLLKRVGGKGGKILLYGMNILARVLSDLAPAEGIEIAAVTDSKHYNEQKRRMFQDVRIVPSDQIGSVSVDHVIICATTGNWPVEIYDGLRREGIETAVLLKDSQKGWLELRN